MTPILVVKKWRKQNVPSFQVFCLKKNKCLFVFYVFVGFCWFWAFRWGGSEMQRRIACILHCFMWRKQEKHCVLSCFWSFVSRHRKERNRRIEHDQKNVSFYLGFLLHPRFLEKGFKVCWKLGCIKSLITLYLWII